jgi:hypothetical protein
MYPVAQHLTVSAKQSKKQNNFSPTPERVSDQLFFSVNRTLLY